jgi:hypothetical protein
MPLRRSIAIAVLCCCECARLLTDRYGGQCAACRAARCTRPAGGVWLRSKTVHRRLG